MKLKIFMCCFWTKNLESLQNLKAIQVLKADPEPMNHHFDTTQQAYSDLKELFYP